MQVVFSVVFFSSLLSPLTHTDVHRILDPYVYMERVSRWTQTVNRMTVQSDDTFLSEFTFAGGELKASEPPKLFQRNEFAIFNFLRLLRSKSWESSMWSSERASSLTTLIPIFTSFDEATRKYLKKSLNSSSYSSLSIPTVYRVCERVSECPCPCPCAWCTWVYMREWGDA